MSDDRLEQEISEAIHGMRTRQEAFALATIVRTAGPTSAKPGAKAVLDAQGHIVFGWLRKFLAQVGRRTSQKGQLRF